jgi:hypothetical protein
MSIPRFDPTRRYTDRAEIMALLDRWVAANGNGTYVPPDERAAASLELFPDYGIQQVRDEIAAFVDVVLTLPRRTLIVEIGLGFFGSTHFLWRMMFDRVVTIERSVERCRSFARAFASFTDGYWCGTDGRSGFVYGPSQDPSLVLRTYRNCPEGATSCSSTATTRSRASLPTGFSIAAWPAAMGSWPSTTSSPASPTRPK